MIFFLENPYISDIQHFTHPCFSNHFSLTISLLKIFNQIIFFFKKIFKKIILIIFATGIIEDAMKATRINCLICATVAFCLLHAKKTGRKIRSCRSSPNGQGGKYNFRKVSPVCSWAGISPQIWELKFDKNMQNSIYIAIFVFFSFFLSCGKNKIDRNSVSLIKTEKTLSFPLDSETKTLIMALFPYTDSKGNEYLTFQNERKNEILFYEMTTGKFLYKIKPELEGPNGVGRLLGYYIEDLNNIFLTKRDNIPIITLIDSNAVVKERINYGKDSNGLELRQSTALSFAYKPIIKIGNKMYHTSRCSRFSDPNPVSITIDMLSKKVESLPFEYPIVQISNDKSKESSIEELFSRCYDGSLFIYSFHYDKHIYVATPDHQSVRKILVESNFVHQVEFSELKTSGDPMKNMIEVSQYGNLYFDPYRDVYYRVAYPKNEVDAGENYVELWNYGRKVFSIIILDRDFQIIGETLFPEYIYNPGVMFILEDGLYISTSHVKNPDYDDDVLTFECFQLEKNNLK